MNGPGIQPFRIFVASPGDVATERGHVRDAIARVNQDPDVRGRAVIYDESWDSTPGRDTMPANRDAQEVIESRASPEECDLVVGILWQRLGHPLPPTLSAGGREYRSGTERELFLALEADRTVWIFHNQASDTLDINDPDFKEKSAQLIRVKDLIGEFHPANEPIERYVNQYNGADEFAKTVYESLRRHILDWLRDQPTPEPQPPAAPPPPEAVTQLTRGEDFPEQGPYRGLLAYTRDYPKIFAGRQRDIDRLVTRVTEQGGFVPVLGASGAGKSSLVEAGLIPALAARTPAWEATEQVSPGDISDDPFIGVAAALRAFASPTAGPLAKQLRFAAQAADPQALRSLLPGLDQLGASLLVFIDQFEELFTVCRETDREPFGWLLAQLAAREKMCVVVTMRNDFYHRIADVPSLLELFGAPAILLGPPAPEQLRQIATEPLARAGARLDDTLLNTLLRDAGTGPGVLPLLAFTLDALWQHCDDPAKDQTVAITESAYKALGGVAGAVRRQADAALGTLALAPKDLDRAFTHLFVELVSLDEERRPTRRRAPWPGNDDNVASLAEALVNARLLVVDGEQTAPDRTLEVAHEALFTQWPRLKQWLSDRGDDLSLMRQLERDAKRWAESVERRHGDELTLRWHRGRTPEIRRALSTIIEGGVEALAEPMRSFVCPRREDWERVDRPFPERIELRERAMDFAARPPKGMDLDGEGLPDIDWVEIPGGEVALEGNAGTFKTPAQYALGRYPVTYAQFMAFLADEESSPKGPWYEGLKHPHGDERPKPTIREPWRPVIGVSWFDAVAFCRWLTARRADVLGDQVIRLPTEWEWEWAARGRDERREFAWEGEFVNGYANLLEEEAGTTSPVDLCPHGVTRDGLWDCTGNVEEWCLNEFGQPEEHRLAGAEERSVRGGNWGLARRYSGCAYRYRLLPGYRYFELGFRVCRGSPS